MSDFSRSFMTHVYETIMHGDDEHRQWLKDKCDSLVPALDKKMKIRDGALAPVRTSDNVCASCTGDGYFTQNDYQALCQICSGTGITHNTEETSSK